MENLSTLSQHNTRPTLAVWQPSAHVRGYIDRFLVQPQGGRTIFNTPIELEPIQKQVLQDISYVMSAAQVWLNHCVAPVFQYIHGVRMDERIIVLIGNFILSARGTLNPKRNCVCNNSWMDEASRRLHEGWNSEIIQNTQHNRGGEESPLDIPTAHLVITWWWGRFGRHDAERSRRHRENASRQLAEARHLRSRLADFALTHIIPATNTSRNDATLPSDEVVNATRDQVMTLAVTRAAAARATQQPSRCSQGRIAPHPHL